MTKQCGKPINFLKDRRGSVAITFGLTSVIAIGAAGGALDYGRAFHARSKLQSTLDAAVIAGLANYRTSNTWASAQAAAEAVFWTQYTKPDVGHEHDLGQAAMEITPGFATPVPAGETPAPNLKMTELAGHAKITVATPFIKLITGENMEVLSATSGIPENSKKLEVAVMVDLTGSMGGTVNGVSKIQALKTASADLLNILLPAAGTRDATVRVGIVPFSDYVNAGEFADEVTGEAATGGSMTNITDLSRTKNGTFNGTYSGWTAGTAGSGSGAISSNSSYVPSGYVAPVAGSSVSASTFNNAHSNTCVNPTSTTTRAAISFSGDGYTLPAGQELDRENMTVTSMAGLKYESNSGSYKFHHVTGVTRSSGALNWSEEQHNEGFYVPILSDRTGLTERSRTANWSYQSKTGHVGVAMSVSSEVVSSNLVPAQFKKVGTDGITGYWKLTKLKNNSFDTSEYYWVTSGYYLPIYESIAVTTTAAGCESAPVTTTTAGSSKLITCVTERVNKSGTTVTGLNYTDAAPTTGNFIGTYNHGGTKSNYSSDGKCYVAGRELPKVIPLTNNRTTLSSFFTNATIGGATPGQLGTAWSMYMLSPNWSTIWGASAAPAAYTDTNTIKAAILMTDGEYNLQYQSTSSANQALRLCKEMRDKGISVYTIGFGFAENATAPTPDVQSMSEAQRTTTNTSLLTAKDRALDTLAKCASNNSSYYFPYDGEALKTVFQNISNSLVASQTTGGGRISE